MKKVIEKMNGSKETINLVTNGFIILFLILNFLYMSAISPRTDKVSDHEQRLRTVEQCVVKLETNQSILLQILTQSQTGG